MGQHEQAKDLSQQSFIIDESAAVDPADAVDMNGGCRPQRLGDLWFGVENQHSVNQHLNRISLCPANWTPEFYLSKVGAPPLEVVQKAQCKTLAGALIAVGGCGKDDTGVALHNFGQYGCGNGGGLINQNQISCDHLVNQPVRGDKLKRNRLMFVTYCGPLGFGMFKEVIGSRTAGSRDYNMSFTRIDEPGGGDSQCGTFSTATIGGDDQWTMTMTRRRMDNGIDSLLLIRGGAGLERVSSGRSIV